MKNILNRIANIASIIWLVGVMGVFAVIAINSSFLDKDPDFSNPNNQLGTISLVLFFISGGIAFVVALFSTIISFFIKKRAPLQKPFLGLSFGRSAIYVGVILFINFTFFVGFAKGFTKGSNLRNVTINSSISPTILPTSTNKTVSTTKSTAQSQTFNRGEETINCISNECGTIRLTKEVCDKASCCKIGSKWYWYQSEDKCKSDQQAYWKTYYDILYGNTTTNTFVPNTVKPLDVSSYSLDSSSVSSYNKQTQTSFSNLQNQLNQIYQNTMNTVNSDINSVKEDLKSKTPQYATWGDYYDAHPHEDTRAHNRDEAFPN